MFIVIANTLIAAAVIGLSVLTGDAFKSYRSDPEKAP